MGSKRLLSVPAVLCLVLTIFIAIAATGLLVGLATRSCSGNPDPPPDVTTATASATTATTAATESTTTAAPLPTTATTRATTAPPGDEPWRRPRLPAAVAPLRYAVHLYPNLDDDRYYGNVDVDFRADEATLHVVLHAQYVAVSQVALRTSGGDDVAVARSFLYEENQYFVVESEVELAAGAEYRLSLTYEGDLLLNIVGIYKSTYAAADGTLRNVASSKFQPTYARQAFPCWDEPQFKATFDVTLVHPGDPYYALANMPEKETRDSATYPGLYETEFETSVPMSTYLVEFIIADFGFVENMTASGIPHRIYAQSGQLNRTDYPLWFGTNTLDFFESYFNVPYTLAKLDEVAIPDFVSGGMEHWGVITYRESNLLYDDMHSSTYNKERVAMIIGHEIVHQWWGNLVTCDWWNDLWLNEGSARWLQQIVADTFNPEFEAYNIFISSYLLGVLDVDATVNSRPVYVAPSAVEHPDEITAIFDDVVYSKGASMLRYLENLLGASVYRDGLEGLLKGLAFKTMVTDDYWDYMSRASGKDVKTMMDPWTLQMGYPVIDVTHDPKDRLKVTLRQERFLLNPDADLSTEQFPSPFNYTWDIYIEYITSDNPHTPYRVHMKMGEEVRLDWPDVEWVKLNYGFTTFCRVNYELQDWLQLSQLLVDDHTALAPSDRVNLLSDAFALAEARRLDYGVPLNMTRYLDREDHYVPWHGVYRRLADISTLLYYRPDYDLLRRYIVAKVDPSFQKLGWDVVGTHLEKRLRPDLIELACWHGDAECIRVATDLFTSWLEAEAYLHPDVRNLVYKYGMIAVGGTDEWEIMWQRYKSEINAQERINLMYGLANSRMPWVLQRYLILAWDLNNVRMQDYWTVLGYIADNPVGRPIVWDYYRANWDSFVERFTLNDRTFGRFIQIVTASFTTDFHLQQMLDFYAQHPDAGAGELPRRQALETVQGNIAWLQRNEADIIDWLHLYGNS